MVNRGQIRPAGLRAWSLVALVGFLTATRATAEVARQPSLRGPARLVLGESPAAEIELVGFSAGDADVFANVGDISPPRPGPRGRLVAQYHLPRERYPQVAILAAASKDRRSYAWTAIPLHGHPQVRVKSSQRGTVWVRAGDREYGPVRTDRRGRAKVTVVIPPGVRQGTTIVRGRRGLVKEEPLAFEAPPVPRVLVVCPRPGDARLLLFVVDSAGRADGDEPPVVFASAGKVAAPARLGTGVYRAELAVADDVAGSVATVTARPPGEGEVASQCEVALPRERPAAVAVELSAEQFAAGSGAAITASVALLYRGRRPPRREKLVVAADFGAVSELRPSGEGRHEVTWRLPDELGGRHQARITITGESKGVGASKTVALAPGPIARLEALPADEQITGDGSSRTRIRVVAADPFGNRVSAPELVARGRGTIGMFASRGTGVYEAVYTAPRTYVPLRDEIVIVERASGIRTTAAIDVRPMRRPFVTGVYTGYQTNFGKVSSTPVLVSASYRLPVWRRRVRAGLGGGYYHSLVRRQARDASDEVTIEVRAVPVLVQVAAELGGGRFGAGLGGGAGVFFAERAIASSPMARTSETAPSLAAGAFARAGVALGPGRMIGEASYWMARIRHPALAGNLAGLFLTSGYELDW